MTKTKEPETPTKQPTISTLKTRPPVAMEGELVLMRVTAKGHGEISTGEEYGFERYAMFAEFICPASSARTLYNRGWAEPVGSVEEVRSLTLRWLQMDKDSAKADAKSKAARDHLLANGADAGGVAGWN
jgi:hypothetical protein